MALSAKQKMFVEAYLRLWNATAAALEAGYSEKTARQQGSRLLTNVDISVAIRARLTEAKMSADEVLLRISDTARNSTMEHFVRVEGNDLVLDFSTAQGKLHHLKKVKRTRRTFGEVTEETLEVEVHDKGWAQQLLGKHHRLFADRVEVDWRREMEGAGLDPDTELDELTRQFEEHLRSRAQGADSGSVEAGASAD